MEIDRIETFLEYFEKIRARTLRVASAIPADHIEWTYREGKFSFADLLRHLGAIERFMFVENACGRPSRYPGHGRDLADGYDEVFSFVDRCHRESVALLRELGQQDLVRKSVTPAGIEITTWKWLRAMVEHEIHHRGQIYLYLSMLGLPSPPLYALTSEEVRERSLGGSAGTGPLEPESS